MSVDRRALREEVQDRAARIRRRLSERSVTNDLPERLAIQQVLTNHGFLFAQRGGWC